MQIDTRDGKNAAILNAFIKHGRERVKPPEPPAPPAPKTEVTEALRPVSTAERARVAMINMGGEQPVTAGTGAVPTPDQSTVAPSVSSLTKEVFTVDSVTT